MQDSCIILTNGEEKLAYTCTKRPGFSVKFAVSVFMALLTLLVPSAIYAENSATAHRTESDSIRTVVYFPVSQTEIMPDFSDNRANLDELDRIMHAAIADKTLEIEHIDITGYASPEGGYKLNQRLSRERAESLGE